MFTPVDFINPPLEPQMMGPSARVIRIHVAMQLNRKATLRAEISITREASSAEGELVLWLIHILPQDDAMAVNAAEDIILSSPCVKIPRSSVDGSH